MNPKQMFVISFFAALAAGGCILPGPDGRLMIVPPPLPAIVELLESGPYYPYGGNHYYYRNNGWFYAHKHGGALIALPRDHYPREVRFKNRPPGRSDRGGKYERGHEGRH